MGGFANGAARSALGRPAAHTGSGTAWVAGYSARMQEPGAEAVPEARRCHARASGNVYLENSRRPAPLLGNASPSTCVSRLPDWGGSAEDGKE